MHTTTTQGGTMKNCYVIFQANSDVDLAAGRYPYTKLAVYRGRTARHALERFAADRGITISGGPAYGGHWLQGQKQLASFGQGQYKADITTLPANIEAAV
jgi:hypothetical protein